MPYTSDLRELIKRVEATRPARVEKKKRGEEFPLLSLKEREERLRKYHPDFIEGARKEIRVGPNKGCLLYTSPSPRDGLLSRMPSSA